MARFTSPLEGVRIAAPCKADWEKMVGDERVRYCGQCSLHVYNLSGMTKRQAETLVASAEGRLCVRYYRRADGSILTRNCPVGLRAIKQRVSRIAGAALSAVLGFFAGLGLNFGLGTRTSPPTFHTMGAVVMTPDERDRLVPPPPPPMVESITVEAGGLSLPIHPLMGKVQPKVKRGHGAAASEGKQPKHTR